MTACALDASALIKWFKPAGEDHVSEAAALLTAYSAGALLVIEPPLLPLEILNAAARRWRWTRAGLDLLATRLDMLGLEYCQPTLRGIAGWTAAGLTAYDACYAALAEERKCFLVTDDALILRTAPSIARSLPAAAAALS